MVIEAMVDQTDGAPALDIDDVGQPVEVAHRQQHSAAVGLLEMRVAPQRRQQQGENESGSCSLSHVPVSPTYRWTMRGVMKMSSSSLVFDRFLFLNRCPRIGMLASPGTRSWDSLVDTS